MQAGRQAGMQAGSQTHRQIRRGSRLPHLQLLLQLLPLLPAPAICSRLRRRRGASPAEEGLGLAGRALLHRLPWRQRRPAANHVGKEEEEEFFTSFCQPIRLIIAVAEQRSICTEFSALLCFVKISDLKM